MILNFPVFLSVGRVQLDLPPLDPLLTLSTAPPPPDSPLPLAGAQRLVQSIGSPRHRHR